MPFLIVEVTSPPARKAPRNSNTAAIITACFKVRALLPTEVPIAFATSLAPIPHAAKKPNIQAITKMKNGEKNRASISIILTGQYYN